MSRIPRDLLEKIERKIPSRLRAERHPYDDDKIRILGYHRSEDTERRNNNRESINDVRRRLTMDEIDMPVEVTDIGDIESRYSQIHIDVTVNHLRVEP